MLEQVITPHSPRLRQPLITSAIAVSQGARSASVNGCPLFILATFAGGCSLSPSSNLQQSRLARCCPIVVLPAPDTPMMTTIAGPSTDCCTVPRHRHRRFHRTPCPPSEVSPTL